MITPIGRLSISSELTSAPLDRLRRVGLFGLFAELSQCAVTSPAYPWAVASACQVVSDLPVEIVMRHAQQRLDFPDGNEADGHVLSAKVQCGCRNTSSTGSPNVSEPCLVVGSLADRPSALLAPPEEPRAGLLAGVSPGLICIEILRWA